MDKPGIMQDLLHRTANDEIDLSFLKDLTVEQQRVIKRSYYAEAWCDNRVAMLRNEATLSQHRERWQLRAPECGLPAKVTHNIMKLERPEE